MAKELSDDTARALLDKLATDDEFRALFEKDAQAALVQIGAPAEAAQCCKVDSGKSLASKEEIAKSSAALFEQLTSAMSDSVHKLSI